MRMTRSCPAGRKVGKIPCIICAQYLFGVVSLGEGSSAGEQVTLDLSSEVGVNSTLICSFKNFQQTPHEARVNLTVHSCKNSGSIELPTSAASAASAARNVSVVSTASAATVVGHLRAQAHKNPVQVLRRIENL